MSCHRPRRPSLLLCLSLLLLLLCTSDDEACWRRVRGTIMASSQIEYCTNTGDEPANCSRKMIVTLSVDGGQAAGADEVVYVKTATDTTDLLNNDGKKRNTSVPMDVEFEPIRLTLSRSAVRYRYPVYYVRNFNAQPREDVIPGTLLRQCNANLDASTATCGVQFDQQGTPIQYSQGFCCDCSVCEVLGVCKAGSRMADKCSLLADYTSAFCLRFGDVWYAGYTIGPHSTWYTLDVHVAANATPQNGTVLHLSPDAPGDTATLFGVVARLLGDLAPTVQPWMLEKSMLFVPTLPRGSARVTAGPREWLLLDKSLVTQDGRECNKVGVSYEAFVSQGGACQLSSGSCLQSQLEDYRTADLTALRQGKRATYLATALDAFDLQQYTTKGHAYTMPYLTYIPASPPTALVTLTLNADMLHYVVAVAKGRIVSAIMTEKTVAASTRDGMLLVNIENTGSITASFSVSVVNCTDGVFPIPAQKLSLTKNQRQQLRFDVTVQSVAYDGKAVCTVVLRDALEAVVDTANVTWQVVPVNTTSGAQGDTPSGDGGYSGGVVTGRDRSSCATCSAVSLSCAFGQRCPHAMGTQLGILLAVLLSLLALFLCRARLRACCCCCCCGGGQRRQRRRRGGGMSSDACARREPAGAGAATTPVLALTASEPFARTSELYDGSGSLGDGYDTHYYYSHVKPPHPATAAATASAVAGDASTWAYGAPATDAYTVPLLPPPPRT